jgi:hypothetical protein
VRQDRGEVLIQGRLVVAETGAVGRQARRGMGVAGPCPRGLAFEEEGDSTAALQREDSRPQGVVVRLAYLAALGALRKVLQVEMASRVREVQTTVVQWAGDLDNRHMHAVTTGAEEVRREPLELAVEGCRVHTSLLHWGHTIEHMDQLGRVLPS